MTAAELRRALEALPDTAALTLTVGELREALNGNGAALATDTPAVECALTARDVAARLGVSERWVYDHAAQLGGKRLSRRCVRFPETALRRYLERRR